ncbi:MAG: tRNA (5-methylaminomethyl-2-thiouridine)(34)-methyltransferase MnmD [Chlorobi bacterium]|nr:tRNA (5-methylaminomethyl-2-thiouridine)(34)-methyltransferase MnmD [Chlorobiota bacterium]
MKHRLKSGRDIELKLSEDGSHTLFVPELNEHYHSVYGAKTESIHVFINSGLKHLNKENIRILEIGFGTGLNALLTALYKGNHKIEYHSIEKYPLNTEIEKQLQISENTTPEEKNLFDDIHSCKWNTESEIIPGFKLLKIEADLLTFSFTHKYDLVYFDAFGPDVQPEMWSTGIFRKIYNSMNKNGILTTYSAKGAVRRAMQDVGFRVERLPGPPHKREMLRASKV